METQRSCPPAATREDRIDRPHRLAVTLKIAAAALTVTTVGLIGVPARAADGCLAMLCLAAPSWSSIQQCVATVESVLNDLAHGRPFPSCDMAGAGNNATLEWSNPPTFCPPQYTTTTLLESTTTYQCLFAGAVEVDVNGALWTRTWWSESGDSVTEFTPAAKAALGTWDPRFDNDYAAWLGAQAPAAAPACASC